MSATVIVSIPSTAPAPRKATDPKPSHHGNGHFINPWKSWVDFNMPLAFINMLRDYESHPIPSPELLPKVRAPDWGLANVATEDDKEAWARDIKATWLGHACFLVEFPAPPGSSGRGPRVLFDPVFSHRCSPSQYIGPARVTQPPMKLSELPHVDAVVLSHNHYDHTDVATLNHIYRAQEKGSSLGFSKEHVTEMDWWEERDITIPLPANSKGDKPCESSLRITCTPCQHFTGRSITDHYKTLWSSWAVTDLSLPAGSNAKVWFGGDTGYRAIPRGTPAPEIEKLPSCPAFKEIGERFKSFDLALIPIGAYDPPGFMSRIHASPEDAVDIHIDVKSKRSLGMHWGTWVLTCEEMTEPPIRLKASTKEKGVPEGQFGICDIGETVRITPGKE